VPMAAVVGSYAYGEAIDLWVFLGGAIIVLANYRTVMTERRAGVGSPSAGPAPPGSV
jgi:hypothetical protein